VDLVQAFDEEQVGELLDDGERVGDAAGPQGVPDAVDFGFDFACDHWMGKNAVVGDTTPQDAPKWKVIQDK
jgi:hypothetical protein